MKISQKLKQAVDHSGLKKKDVAARAGITQVALSKYLSGEVTPKMENLTKIANALGLSPSYFYDYPEDQTELQMWRQRALDAESKLSMLKSAMEGWLSKL